MADAFQLGASLYVPALHPKLGAVLAQEAHPDVKSVIVCTEDAVAERDLDQALRQLRETLRTLRPTPHLLRFVRVRNPAVMREVVGMPGSEKLDGFVLPKVTAETLPHYNVLLSGSQCLMPTLETAEVFEPDAMRALRAVLLQPGLRERILALRIGGNDLLRLLGMRRPRGVTLYDTPLGVLLGQLVLIFKPHGFALTAPVFDFLDDPALLREEARRDLAFGFCGKTAVHPSQVAVIQDVFKVQAIELEAAQRLVAPDCPAVFQLGGAMYEAAVHGPWAQRVFSRAQHFGVEPQVGPEG
jgi:citrate lyase beta subunit